MRKKGTKTKYPGVKMVTQGLFQLRVWIVDPRTGQEKEVTKLVEAPSAKDAAAMRADLTRDALPTIASKRTRVVDFARSWIESKAGVVSRYTLEGYTYALDKHVYPILGNHFYDTVGHLEVQAMVNKWLVAKKENGAPLYFPESVKDWFRVFRNMTRDAIVQLGLERDPTLRISFGENAIEQEESTLTPAECTAFLAAMQRKRPGTFALAKTKSLTGQRFCHVSALQWHDIDFDGMLIHFRRKQVRGVVGPISKKKPAPKEVPMLPELADALRAHRERLQRLGYRVGNEDWVFPSRKGKLRIAGSLAKAFEQSAKEAKIKKRVTPHKLRYFFNDALRLAGVDPVTGKALTGHVTEDMRRHYSTVRLDEKRAAMEAVARTVHDVKPGPRPGPAGGGA